MTANSQNDVTKRSQVEPRGDTDPLWDSAEGAGFYPPGHAGAQYAHSQPRSAPAQAPSPVLLRAALSDPLTVADAGELCGCCGCALDDSGEPGAAWALAGSLLCGECAFGRIMDALRELALHGASQDAEHAAAIVAAADMRGTVRALRQWARWRRELSQLEDELEHWATAEGDRASAAKQLRGTLDLPDRPEAASQLLAEAGLDVPPEPALLGPELWDLRQRSEGEQGAYIFVLDRVRALLTAERGEPGHE